MNIRTPSSVEEWHSLYITERTNLRPVLLYVLVSAVAKYDHLRVGQPSEASGGFQVSATNFSSVMSFCNAILVMNIWCCEFNRDSMFFKPRLHFAWIPQVLRYEVEA